MEKHPFADIEWYEGGMTMEEQQEYRILKQQQRKSFKLKVTPKQKEKYENKLISKLTQEKAADNEYISELQDKIQLLTSDITTLNTKIEALEKENETIRKHWHHLQSKYGTDLCTLKQEPIFQKYEESISTLKNEIKEWKSKYEVVLYQLIKVNGQL